mmetsp:Transcript_37505/g.92829  ORF Transcript_37505/g.92829 Transcript_37505/m.92829 type:complete len:274 (-) Transcript_37505:418-1239(-)
MALFLAESVTMRTLPSRLRSSRLVSWLPSTTSVTSCTAPASAARLVRALCASRRFSSAAQLAISAGREVMALCSASSTLSCDSCPMAVGREVRALLEMMSVLRPERRETSEGRRVRRAPSFSLRLLTEEAHHSAGSTSSPPGNAGWPGVSMASSLRLPDTAFSTSGHTGDGREEGAEDDAFAAAGFGSPSSSVLASSLSSSSSSFLPPPPVPVPRRSFASSSRFLRLLLSLAVSPSGAFGSSSSSSSSPSASSSLSPPRLMRPASSAWPFLLA